MKYDEEVGFGSLTGVSCKVRSYTDGTKFEIEFTDDSKSWLTNERMAVDNNNNLRTLGEMNREYLHKKLAEYIELVIKDDENEINE